MWESRIPRLGSRGEGWVVLQVVLFVAICASGFSDPAWRGSLRIVSFAFGGLLICAGALLSLVGLLDLREHLTPFPKPMEGSRLIDTGAYRLARHPIYGGLITAAFGWGIATASPLAILGALILGVFFDLKSRREEIWLAEQFPDYAAYKARTRRLLPWLY
jgi:protein-S-isoprenylcysteine O-methyltransferase Ste14